MDYYNAVLERIDHNGKLVSVVSEITIEALDMNEAQLVAHNWVLTFLTFSENYHWERHPYRFLAVSGFGNTYGIDGYCSQAYLCRGKYVRAGGYKLFLSPNS